MAIQKKYSWSIIYLSLVIFVVAVSIAAWTIVESLVETSFETRTRADLESEMNTFRARMEKSVGGIGHVVHGVMAAIVSEPDLSQARFDGLAEHFFGLHPELRNLAAAPDLIVKYVYPPAGNESVIGLNYWQVPSQLPAVERAIAAQGVVLAGPVHLVQGGEGLISRAPVFIRDHDTGKQTLWGIISAVVDVERFFKGSGLRGDLPYDIAIRGTDGMGAQGEVFFGRPDVFELNPVLTTINVPDGTWVMASAPKAGWPEHPDNINTVRAYFLLGGALFLALVLLVARLVHLRLQADERLSAAINSLGDGFALFDANDRLVSCNDKYREFYNLSGDLFKVGNSFEYIVREGIKRGQYPDSAGQEDAWFAQRMSSHRLANSVVEQRLENGRWLKVAESRTPDGGTVGFRVDITELKNAKEAAEKASRAKSDFLNVISHELRTPLTVILGFASFLAKPGLLPSVKKLKAPAPGDAPLTASELQENIDGFLKEITTYAGKIGKSGQHLLALINDMLDLSKIEANKMEITVAPVPVDPVFESIVEEFTQAAVKKGITLSCTTNGANVLADELRLKQMLINLVGNAIKFTDKGSITISSKPQGKFIKIMVTDTGCGVPEAEISEIFERFSQVDISSTRKAGGTGLGLAITKRFAELHGGEIRVESTVGEGSTFSFTIPAA